MGNPTIDRLTSRGGKERQLYVLHFRQRGDTISHNWEGYIGRVCVYIAYSWNHAEALETEAGTRMS